jgi:hypothetical protein
MRYRSKRPGALAMETIHAIYENGASRALGPVTIPEGTEVAFEPRVVGASSSGVQATPAPIKVSEGGLRSVYALLTERFESGHHDTAARHNEHQP